MSILPNGWLKFITGGSKLTATPPPTLLTIPGELRVMIYKFALLESDKVYPFDYKPCSCDCPKHKRTPPNVALLRVNRQINLEATPVLYTGVTVRISTGYFFMKFMSAGDVCMYGAPTPNRFFQSRHYIRSLRIKFIPEYLPSDVRSGHILECWSDPPFRLLSKKQRALAIHRYNRELCQAVWTNAGKVITQMAGLDTLHLDIEQTFCPLGCCRMVGHVLRSLQGIRKKGGFILRVSGELNIEELNMLLKGLSYFNDESFFVPGLSAPPETEDDDDDDDEDEDNEAEDSEDEEDGEDDSEEEISNTSLD